MGWCSVCGRDEGVGDDGLCVFCWGEMEEGEYIEYMAHRMEEEEDWDDRESGEERWRDWEEEDWKEEEEYCSDWEEEEEEIREEVQILLTMTLFRGKLVVKVKKVRVVERDEEIEDEEEGISFHSLRRFLRRIRKKEEEEDNWEESF